MSSPNLLSTAGLQVPGGSVVAEGESTVHNGLSRLESTFKPRAYQLEMLEQSMQRNIIVAVRLSWSLLLLQRLIHFRWILGQAKREFPFHHTIRDGDPFNLLRHDL